MDVRDRAVADESWFEACADLARSGATMLDFLAVVDEPAAGQVEVVVHLVDVSAHVRYLLRTRVDRDVPVLASLVSLYPGAAWHEREAHEMFGVDFAGNEDLRPLLTDGEAGLPLRRTTPLPTRVQTAWPGAVDPADRRTAPALAPAGGPAAAAAVTGSARPAARPRSRPLPPGVHAEWQR